LIKYADASYLSDPYKERSQTNYLFTYGSTVISWRFVKQTLVATSSNHSEIIAIYEASRHCIWLRSIIQHIKENSGLSTIEDSPTILFEDNVASITQLRGDYIKEDKTKHISPKFFYTHGLQQKGKIDIIQIRSNDNLKNLFTKSLPASTFKKLVHNIVMCILKIYHKTCTFELKLMQIVLFFLFLGFSYWILLCKVLMRQFDIFMNPKAFKYRSWSIYIKLFIKFWSIQKSHKNIVLYFFCLGFFPLGFSLQGFNETYF